MQRSRLVQRQIYYVSDSDKEFAKSDNSNEIPLVLIPKSPSILQLATTIPSGPFVLWQQWHRDMGELDSGVIYFWPSWNRVSHVVSRATISYNAPSKNCPTADNVMVNVDICISFNIGPNAAAARSFVYQIGANRFNDFLSAESEEAIRKLIYTVTHDQINDVRGDLAVKMISILNEKCNRYGVQITNVNVENIVLPEELQLRLERISSLKEKMKENEKIQEKKLRALEDDAEKELETIRKSNARKLQEIIAERKLYEIERRELEEKAKGESRVREVEAMTNADIALKKAQGDEVVAKLNARRKAEALLKKTQLECQTLKLEAEQKAIFMVKESEGQLKIAEAKAKALIYRAEAEAECADNLIEKRKYELEWERLKVLEKLASTGRRFISGERGESILNQLVPILGNEE
mmetsp:Transcript_15789/g.18005  ORF Transcript_15789/g.18005 Transcript_15789/m.18005 type:complete len:409 (+) Transcript_15789:114-1340(+)